MVKYIEPSKGAIGPLKTAPHGRDYAFELLGTTKFATTSFVICGIGDCILAGGDLDSSFPFCGALVQSKSTALSPLLGSRKLDHLCLLKPSNRLPSTTNEVLYEPRGCLVTLVSFLRKLTATLLGHFSFIVDRSARVRFAPPKKYRRKNVITSRFRMIANQQNSTAGDGDRTAETRNLRRSADEFENLAVESEIFRRENEI